VTKYPRFPLLFSLAAQNTRHFSADPELRFDIHNIRRRRIR